jgi:hypothetical protein
MLPETLRQYASEIRSFVPMENVSVPPHLEERYTLIVTKACMDGIADRFEGLAAILDNAPALGRM